ncbi:MAG: alpha/beta hydrolase [Angustibacter sp.]
MRPLIVDTAGLRGLADAVVRDRLRLQEALAIVPAALRAAPGTEPSIRFTLLAVERQRARCFDLLQALSWVIWQVAQEFDTTERSVAAGLAAVAGERATGRAERTAADLVGQSLAGANPIQRAGLGVFGDVPIALPGQVFSLLELADPAVLAGLLVAQPRLARYVVDKRPGPCPGRGLTRHGRAASLMAMRRARSRWLAQPRRERRLTALLQPGSTASRPWAPPADRMAATRVLVAADLARLLDQLATTTGRGRAELAARIDQRRRWLDDRVVLRHPGGRVSRRPHQLLWFDPRVDGQLIEVLGDLRRARHLLVFVPGTGADLRRQPGSLARMATFAAADPDVAVVVWQGADHPDQPGDDGEVSPLRTEQLAAAYRDAADHAGPQLARDVEGLRLAAPGPGADLTVMGHSYGGSILGAAEWSGMLPDRLVHLSSAGTYRPGLPPLPDGIADSQAAGIPGGGPPARYSMTAPDDWIQFVQGRKLDDAPDLARQLALPGFRSVAGWATARVGGLLDAPERIGHGDDPDLLPGVVRLDTGVVDATGRVVSGHGGAFAPGSTAWRNLLEVSRGGPVQVFEPDRWQVHLELAGPHLDDEAPWDPSRIRWEPPRFVVDRSPWSDPAYRPPSVPTR